MSSSILKIAWRDAETCQQNLGTFTFRRHSLYYVGTCFVGVMWVGDTFVLVEAMNCRLYINLILKVIVQVNCDHSGRSLISGRSLVSVNVDSMCIIKYTVIHVDCRHNVIINYYSQINTNAWQVYLSVGVNINNIEQRALLTLHTVGSVVRDYTYDITIRPAYGIN